MVMADAVSSLACLMFALLRATSSRVCFDSLNWNVGVGSWSEKVLCASRTGRRVVTTGCHAFPALLLVGFALQGALVLAVLGGLVGLANQVPSSFAIRMFVLVFVLVLVSTMCRIGIP